MALNDYHFITRWRVEATPEEVSEVLSDSEDLMRWWPAVYLDVKTLKEGGEGGVGAEVSLYTKGWLPYTLRWRLRVSESRYPNGFTLQAFGDFTGRGIWTFEPDGKFVNITYDWKIQANKPLLRYLTPILKPAFSANHCWAMAKGEESLRLELARRHAQGTERAKIPPPPLATATSSIPLVLGSGAGLAGLAGTAYLISKILPRRPKV